VLRSGSKLPEMIDHSLTAKMKLVFTLSRASSYLLASPLADKQLPTNSAAKSSNVLHGNQLHSSGYADATCDPLLVLFSPVFRAPLSA
jgi:hypothetical protein